MQKSKTLRMDNVGIIVQDLESSIGFFEELGFELEGKMSVSGEWVDRMTSGRYRHDAYTGWQKQA